jgi:hypothetical protein
MRNNEWLSPEIKHQSLMGALASMRVIHKMASFFGTPGKLALVQVYKKSLFILRQDNGLSMTAKIAAIIIGKKTERALLEPENLRS